LCKTQTSRNTCVGYRHFVCIIACRTS
jgi:hypothetical protein